MNVWNLPARLVVIGCLSAQAGFAIAQDDDSIYGTHSVTFQPTRSSGVLKGCALLYRAVQADYVYQNGKPVVIVGNIGVHQSDAKMGLTLKIGVKDLDVPSAPFTRPYFAYLQTTNVTTVKSTQKTFDGDEGFRFVVVGLNEASSKLLLEMLESGKVTIGFNRHKGGLDVLVPIDLKVFDAEYPSSGNVVRKRSNEAITEFLGCYKELLEQGISKSPQ